MQTVTQSQVQVMLPARNTVHIFAITLIDVLLSAVSLRVTQCSSSVTRATRTRLNSTRVSLSLNDQSSVQHCCTSNRLVRKSIASRDAPRLAPAAPHTRVLRASRLSPVLCCAPLRSALLCFLLSAVPRAPPPPALRSVLIFHLTHSFAQRTEQSRTELTLK